MLTLDKSHADVVEHNLLISFEQAVTVPVQLVKQRGALSDTCIVIYIGVTKIGALNEEKLSYHERSELLLDVAANLQIGIG